MPRSKLPSDAEGLAKVKVDLPRLKPDTAKSCPVKIADIVHYLQLESPDGESIDKSDLHFLRTALVEKDRYWIWSFQESDGDDCYVTASARPNGDTCVGYDQNLFELTPEQYMLGDYHQMF